MLANLNEAIAKIKNVGSINTRIVPMNNEHTISGKHQIEIRESGNWIVLINGLLRPMAEDIINQATNRVILG